tara:strand:- start:7895 stop:8080 length:186 start_codon:yes stop_codon:yes gene_type:complete
MTLFEETLDSVKNYCAICEDGKLFPKDKCQTCKTKYEDAVPLSEREDLMYWTEPKPYFKIV